jgi:ssDNA-binding Zn-finger/Zn-ribbon topoisomerase 1
MKNMKTTLKETNKFLVPYPDFEEGESIKCPKCKHKIEESWEYLDNTDRGILDCPNCDIELYFEVQTTVEYTVFSKKELDRYRGQFMKDKESSKNDPK